MKAPRPSEMSIQHLTTNGQVSADADARCAPVPLSDGVRLSAADPGGGGQRPVRVRPAEQIRGGLQEGRARLQRAAHLAAV